MDGFATAETLDFFANCVRLPSPNVLATHRVRKLHDKDTGINAAPTRLGSLVANTERSTRPSVSCVAAAKQSVAKCALEDMTSLSAHVNRRPTQRRASAAARRPHAEGLPRPAPA
ncbi:Aste57867_17250 [Aphanomyces stellatus]|uniref:Aste57867_17250 protein n=1 Tax=Aphanomyces stellatus TaxID=120398 RepID=A0A485L895_9STRA|nr:hypothetical protein As57867_017191 [Aphanomyces stellatus]VFT94006.1 Aste57867_17250 [Aphanomyces stellatus]